MLIRRTQKAGAVSTRGATGFRSLRVETRKVVMTEAVIALGSNIGNREDHIRQAIYALGHLPDTTVLMVSNNYETEPFGVPDEQDDYLNCCLKLMTELQPETLLGACLGIEAAMGKVRTYKNAPRIIDVDLLLYGDLQINSKDLILPHPRMLERAFVLVPLSDIYPNHSALGLDFSQALKSLDISGVKLTERGSR